MTPVIQRARPERTPLRGLRGKARLRAIRDFKHRTRWHEHWSWLDMQRAFSEYAARRRSELAAIGIMEPGF